jgi:hypothetical protein
MICRNFIHHVLMDAVRCAIGVGRPAATLFHRDLFLLAKALGARAFNV